MTYRNNVLNITGDGAQFTNQSILGTGTTSVDNHDGALQTYYGNYDSNYTYAYTLPQAWVLYMNETVEQGRGVLISMGVRALDGPSPDKITWYDKITIVDPGVASADFTVNGREYTPAGADTSIGSFFDAELVFGGGAGGQAATYSLDASLALFYWDQTLRPFPSLYTFGDDTAEAAFNIEVTIGNGVATAQSGTPYYGILTNDFNASLASLVAGSKPQSASPSYLGYPGKPYILRGNFPEGFHGRFAVLGHLSRGVQRGGAGVNQMENTAAGFSGQACGRTRASPLPG